MEIWITCAYMDKITIAEDYVYNFFAIKALIGTKVHHFRGLFKQFWIKMDHNLK